jgi:hypothetical protein
MARRPSTASPSLHLGALALIVAAGAIAATLLHRHGHTQGDDFALYLRQAQSLFQGNPAEIVADNRFSVLNSGPGFSPMAYPWGWPLLLSPFVQFWGLDYDRLKLVVVATMCVWLVLYYGIVRRRAGTAVALGTTAVLASAPAYLTHTDQLISEFPYLASIGLVLWWYDRTRSRGPLIASPAPALFILGALASLAFNVRREGIVLLFVIAAVHVGELVVAAAARAKGSGDGDASGRVEGLVGVVRDRCRAILTPYAGFVGATVGFQMLLPTTLLPDNGNSRSFIPDRLSDAPAVIARQLGLGLNHSLGMVVVALAIVGAALGTRRRPSLDGPLVVLTIMSALLISTHFRLIDRYWFQVTPWVLYFAAVAVWETARLLLRRRPSLVIAVAVVPLLALVVAHAIVLPGDISAARDFNADGRTQFGPAHPDVIPIFEAVEAVTPPDAVIAFYRARTMTLLTDRSSIQTTTLATMQRSADFFAQRRTSDYSQVKLTRAEAEDLGFEEVWRDDTWILWRLPANAGQGP